MNLISTNVGLFFNNKEIFIKFNGIFNFFIKFIDFSN